VKSLYLPKWDTFIRYYTFAGEREPIVYLPGISIPSILNFLPVVTHPRMRGRHSTLVDNLGSGLSDSPTRFSYSMDDHAETVAELLDSEKLSGCTVVGHSMGGTVAIFLALQRPDLVANLIVGEGNLIPGGGIATRHIASFSRDEYVSDIYPEEFGQWRKGAADGDPESTIRLSGWGTADPSGLHGNSVSLVTLDDGFKDRYLGLSMRRTFIYGERSLPKRSEDVLADAPDPRELQAHGVTVGVVPNAGHLLMLDNLDGFVDVLRQAIE
jgi:pimeloyl-ACP methyl ester carboxylesterase